MSFLSPAQAFEIARLADRHGAVDVRRRRDGRLAVTLAAHPGLVDLAIDRKGRTRWLGLLATPDQTDCASDLPPEIHNPVAVALEARPAAPCACLSALNNGGTCLRCGREILEAAAA